MNKIVSKVPHLISKKGWTEQYFVGECVKRGLHFQTAQEIARGRTNMKNHTMLIVLDVFGLRSVSDIIDTA